MKYTVESKAEKNIKNCRSKRRGLSKVHGGALKQRNPQRPMANPLSYCNITMVF